MGDTTQLKAKLAELASNISELGTDLTAAVADLKTAVGNGDQAEIDAAVSSLSDISATVKALDSPLKDIINAAGTAGATGATGGTDTGATGATGP